VDQLPLADDHLAQFVLNPDCLVAKLFRRNLVSGI